MKHPHHLSVLAILLIIILTACSLPAPSEPATQDVAPEFTAAAQTIIAQLTQAAGTQAPPPEETTATPGEVSTEPGLETETAPAVETQTPAETTEPTTTPTLEEPAETATPTSLPSDPRAALGDPDFLDNFQNGDNWSLYEDEHVLFRVADEALRMVAFNAESWDGFMLSWPQINDFYLEMAATTRDCSGLDRYGLVARSVRTDEGYAGYLFGISCDGQYSLRIWDGEAFTRLIDWTASEHIQAGSNQSNRIGIMMEGENISLYANGNLIAELTDETFEDGRIGVFVGSANTEDFTVLVEEVAFWELP